MKTLADIATLLNAPLREGAQQQITGIASLEEASNSEISFLLADSYLKQFAATQAAAVIVSRRAKLPPNPKPAVLLVDDADLAVAKVLALFAPPIPRPPVGIDKAARIASDAVIAGSAAIAPSVFIGHRARIGNRSVLHPGVFIGDDTILGDDCEIFPNVVIRERITTSRTMSRSAAAFASTAPKPAPPKSATAPRSTISFKSPTTA
jgi:UDP-3-O-[3-hydroxymyristoyl] glucosamine N-acyltransferase